VAWTNALHERGRKLEFFSQFKLDFVSQLDCGHDLDSRDVEKPAVPSTVANRQDPVKVDDDGLPITDKRQSGRCVSAAKQNPHRPGIFPALGLRAGSSGGSVCLDSYTVANIFGNTASTSNNDVFGVFTIC
jgi:hypothetical protein